jgi:hypothetical protein
MRNTFITSSPRLLMTFTAILPDFGFSNCRDKSLLRWPGFFVDLGLERGLRAL